MKKLKDTFASEKFKKWTYVFLAIVLVFWVGYRFYVIASENSRVVYNAMRVASDAGVPVSVISVSKTRDVVREPIAVRNNRAYVSGANARQLRVGQSVDNGQIVSVSGGVDFDTGMYVVKTRGVSDGLHYVEFSGNGYFIPAYAVNNDNTVLVIDENGIATSRAVRVARQDSNTAYITDGLTDGDIVILSHVDAGTKVKIAE